jgi:hypothetical protein
MSKLEIEFEITGLKLRIKGESDDVMSKAAAVQRQMQGVIQAVGAITEGATGTAPQQPSNAGPKLLEVTAEPAASNGARGKRGAPRKGGGPRPRAEAIDFKHDADKYGFPKQEWNTGQKSMWLLHVLSLQTGHNEYSAPVVAATFNKHFKSFGAILTTNVLRDLAKEKGKTGWVNSDATQDPQTWYLLEEGKKSMGALILETKAPAA